MALRKKSGQFFGDVQADIRPGLLFYSEKAGYPAEHYADARCGCGESRFRLELDEDQGVAVRICAACAVRHIMADGSEYLENAELQTCSCTCEADVFEITVGVALYEDSEDVRWLYVGCRCVSCGLLGCYGDWKNEFQGYKELLSRV